MIDRRVTFRREADQRRIGSVIVYSSNGDYRAWIRWLDIEQLSSVVLLDQSLMTFISEDEADDAYIRIHGQPVPQHLRPAPREKRG